MSYQYTIQALLEKYMQGDELSVEEARELDRWLEQSEVNRSLFSRLNDEAYINEQLQIMDDINDDRIWEKIEQHAAKSSGEAVVRKMQTRRRYWLVAASVIVLLLAGGYLYRIHRAVDTPVVRQTSPDNIPPGRDGAILTLADGRKVVLDSLGQGIVTTQGMTKVVLNKGQLVYKYDEPSGAGPGEVLTNTMTTPRGRQYQLVLPDGSRVWLNAASSITYPTVFTGAERRVSITGEAYFEVAKTSSPNYRGGRDGATPFIVDINGKATVEVMGTHFNINAYEDESVIKTTLLEGKVKVFAGKRLPTPDSGLPTILSPGEQAQVNDHSSIIRVVKQVDVDQVMAWKNGNFHFNDTDIKTMMRQLARWYDIDVNYPGEIPADRFTGKVSRSFHLSQVLKMLEFSDLDFRIEGKTLLVGK